MGRKSLGIYISILLISVLILAGAYNLSRSTLNQSQQQEYTSWGGYSHRVLVHVTKVFDGDTALVRFPNGTEEKVRFLGVDTPETEEERNRPNEYDHITDLRCLTIWGLKAEQFTKDAIEHKNVYLVFDPISPRRGYYGRLLAYIYLTNGTDFTAELIKRGYARVYVEGKFEKKEEYLRYQQEAMKKGLGLWGACG